MRGGRDGFPGCIWRGSGPAGLHGAASVAGDFVRSAGGGALRGDALHGDGAVRQGAARAVAAVHSAQERRAQPRHVQPGAAARSIRWPSMPPSCASWRPSASRRGIDVPKGQIAIDGKSLRRAYAKGCAHMPPLVVTRFGCDTFMSLAQTVAQKGGEAEAAIAALKLLSLKGVTVTADALHCHRRMTRTIREGGGHYVIAIKGNQSKLASRGQRRPRCSGAEPTRPASIRPRRPRMAATRGAGPSSSPSPRRQARTHSSICVAVGQGRKLAHRRRQDHPQGALLCAVAQNVGRTNCSPPCATTGPSKTSSIGSSTCCSAKISPEAARTTPPQILPFFDDWPSIPFKPIPKKSPSATNNSKPDGQIKTSSAS